MKSRNKRILIRLKKVIWFILFSEKLYLSGIYSRILILEKKKFIRRSMYEGGFYSFLLLYCIYFYLTEPYKIESKDFGLFILSLPVSLLILRVLNTSLYIIYLRIKNDKRLEKKSLENVR